MAGSSDWGRVNSRVRRRGKIIRRFMEVVRVKHLVNRVRIYKNRVRIVETVNIWVQRVG